MHRAFSLVELSIVLVILGLLTGGILAGQSLIRAAELRSVTTEYQRYTAAIQSFRDKYLALPGDMNNATRFWGRAASTADCGTNSAAAIAVPGTCDGNGNGAFQIVAGASQSGETFQFWNQLALAGFIEGQFSGISGPGATGTEGVAGLNIPASKLSSASWQLYPMGVYASSSFFSLDYGNALIFGTYRANNPAWSAILRPEDAWNLDTKLDDGKPAYGKVIGGYWNNACSVADDGSAANNDLAASYNLADTAVRCALIFRQAI